MPKYMTKQRKLLLSYLEAHADTELSACAVASALESEGVSLSAVYRNLDELESEGKLRRTGKGEKREFLFRYIGAEECRGCLHLSCKSCGRTFHMATDEAERLVSSVAQRERFEIDRADTVLYGLCESCKQGGKD